MEFLTVKAECYLEGPQFHTVVNRPVIGREEYWPSTKRVNRELQKQKSSVEPQ